MRQDQIHRTLSVYIDNITIPISGFMPYEALPAGNVGMVDSVGKERTKTITPEVVVWSAELVPVVDDWKFVSVFVVVIPLVFIQKVHTLSGYGSRVG